MIEILSDQENKVIALTGKWGTGKSHLLQEVKTASEDEAIKKAICVSLFGISDMNQLCLKIIQSAIPTIQSSQATWNKVAATLSGLRKVAVGFNKGFSVLDDLAQLALPAILKDRVLVLDDIERKHEKLSIDEILGFIDEFTELYGARIILILNSDQLSDKDMWEKLREKVIDQEVRLDTSSAEAFDIASRLTPTRYGGAIKHAVETIKLTNIRIVRKVIRAINRILGTRDQLPEAVLGRMIPSTVLLSAIHYKGIEDGPPIEFVLQAGSSKELVERSRKIVAQPVQDEHQAKWKLLVHQLGINSSDEYELLVADYLDTGLLDEDAVDLIVSRYVAESDALNMLRRVHQFREHVIWHHKLSNNDLLVEARTLANDADRIDPYTVTSLHELLCEIPGGDIIGDIMVEKWIAAFAKRSDHGSIDRDFFRRKLHPRIEAEFDALADEVEAKTTLYDACAHIANHHSWGTRQEVAMRGSTVHDHEMTIKSLEVEEFKLFMSAMIDMCVNSATYIKHFGSAMDRFTEACRNICSDPNSGRLAQIIRLLFDDAKLASALTSSIENTA
ncbi:P-loop NTPase fold protein [Dyella sp. OK004]|uniref:P-loop NTPase fold protein n=1 Tax=Dyella sp. OK004 TaxID=1855292 RepID=UPI0015A6F7E4|nr:P-loop NTPase fold protein [Dyella sp. OK004]